MVPAVKRVTRQSSLTTEVESRRITRRAFSLQQAAVKKEPASKRERQSMEGGPFEDVPRVTVPARRKRNSKNEMTEENEDKENEQEAKAEDSENDENQEVVALNIVEDRENKNHKIVLTTLFEKSILIDFDFAGNRLYVVGSEDAAKRITMKFKIMEKLANFVGCGLDCHFRCAYDQYRLLLLVKGVPRVLFGADVKAGPHLENIRNYVIPSEWMDAGQVNFFNSILYLIPRKLIHSHIVLLEILMRGEETPAVQMLYSFLGSIRESVLSLAAKNPTAWTIDNFPTENELKLNLNVINEAKRKCGDQHLLKLESAFVEHFCSELGIEKFEEQPVES